MSFGTRDSKFNIQGFHLLMFTTTDGVIRALIKDHLANL